MIRVVHIADVHLDHMDYSGLPTLKSALEDNRYQTFLKAMDLAVEKAADVFVIAGDLFDGDRITLKAVMFLNDGLKYLLDNGVRPVLCLGNHDPMSFYEQWDIQLPDDCIVFGAEPERILLTSRDGEKFSITGCSHDAPNILENRGATYPQAAAKMVNIGVLHGSVDQWADDEDPYMPCTLSELESKQYQLWCLGHIHKRKELRQINGFYPGSLCGNSFKETGAKGAYFYEVSRGHLNYEFIPLSALVFEAFTIDIDSSDQLHAIEELMMALVRQAEVVRKRTEIETGMQDLAMLYRIKIVGRSPLYYRLQDTEIGKQLEETLTDREWIVAAQVDTGELLPDVDLSTVSQNGSFPGYCMELIKDEAFLRSVLKTIETDQLAARELLSSGEQEAQYREHLLADIERDVLKYLLKTTQG